MDIKYEEYLTKLYNFAVCDLLEYSHNIYDIDIMCVVEDLNREETKFYFVSLGVKMLLKLENKINSENVNEYIYATFDVVFKYMFDTDFNFNFSKFCKNFEKFQVALLASNGWTIKILV